MGDHVRLSRGKLRSPRRGTKKPRAHNPNPRRDPAAVFQVFGKLQQREFDRSPWPMRIFEHGTFRFLAVNDAAVKLYGYTREEFLSLTAKDTRHPDEFGEFLTTLDEPTGYFRHRGPRRHVRKNGEIIVVEAVTQDILFRGRKARLSMNIDITERNKAEDEVRRQKNLFAAVIDNLPVGIFIRDAKTLRYVMRNRFSEKSVGYPVETSIGKTVYDVFPKEQADLATATDRIILESGQMLEIPEQVMLGKSGKQRLYYIRKVPVFGDDGQPWVLVGIAEDITERKKAENALRESEKRFELAVENTGLGMWDWNVRTSEVWRHPQWARMLGYKPEEVRGHICMWREFCHPDDWAAAQEKLMAHMEGNAPDYATEYRMRKKDGSWLWVVCSGRVIERDADDRPLRMIGYIQDISERKQGEAALKESEERFRQLAENIREVFWIGKPSGENIYVSPGYEEIWGRSLESLSRDPRSWMEAIYPDDRPAVLVNQQKMARGEPSDVEYRIIRPDGTLRWIMDRSYPMIRSDGTRLVCGIAEDITKLKQAEQERFTQVIEQRDTLVREVHHRIKNSLQGVTGLLRQKIAKFPAIAPSIEEAIAQLQSVALVYGLQETRSDGLLSLADITNAICSSAESLIGGCVERTFESNSQRPACLAGAEAVSVAVALNELVFNALKHQPAEAGEKLARVTLRETSDAAEIRIVNCGRLPSGFDFARSRAVGHGLGLVRTLLASPGGTVAFNGGPDEVEVVVMLGPPLLVERQKTTAR